MWIKKMNHSLYTIIYIRIVSATVISIMAFGGLIWWGLTSTINKQNEMITLQKQEIEGIIAGIEQKVDEHGLTFAMAKGQNFGIDERKFEVELIPSYEISFDDKDVEWLNDDLLTGEVYPIQFSDVEGYVYIELRSHEYYSIIYYIIFTGIVIILFTTLCFWFLKPIIKYIKTIESSVSLIGGNNLLVKVPIIGENELSELAKGINAMGQKLHEHIEHERMIEQNQRALITNISHDLRTPLTSIIGYMDLAKASLEENHEAFGYIDIAKRNSVRLEKHLNDLFLYSKILSHDIAFSYVDVQLNVLMGQILELKRGEIHFLPCEEKVCVKIDVDKFHRVIDNLLINCEKYGVANKPVKVKTYTEGDMVYITIENETDDNLEDKINFLTNRLYVGKEERHESSTGLGLSIAEEFVVQMQGTLSLAYNKPIFSVCIAFETIK